MRGSFRRSKDQTTYKLSAASRVARSTCSPPTRPVKILFPAESNLAKVKSSRATMGWPTSPLVRPAGVVVLTLQLIMAGLGTNISCLATATAHPFPFYKGTNCTPFSLLSIFRKQRQLHTLFPFLSDANTNIWTKSGVFTPVLRVRNIGHLLYGILVKESEDDSPEICRLTTSKFWCIEACILV